MISQIQSAAATVHTDVMAALRTAAHKTGLDFDYLLNTAMRESKLDSQAKSKNSSASGLFQFIDQTWLGLVKQYGERYGLGSYAGAIQQNSSGRYVVASDDTKAAILALRQDPELSAVMAGESAKQTKQSLECALGRKVCAGELYAAHFLGPSGARHLIQLSESNPNMRADIAFPQAAKANKSMFCRADGTAKTVGEVYASVVNRPPQIPAMSNKAQPQMLAAAHFAAQRAFQSLFCLLGRLPGHHGGELRILPQGKNCRLGVVRSDDVAAVSGFLNCARIGTQSVAFAILLDQAKPSLIDELKKP